ncbi:exported hypothetical protein [uncultured Mycobacterium sp.]|uniref:Uncharacterized protein n=1 Tax=uncultured Mycobacterium sp. TaxID=171292 RepID=A0A1Y5PE44_9MYCO|nr:exported hypothetical protein [uncultured Mycobacterium sp.]
MAACWSTVAGSCAVPTELAPPAFALPCELVITEPPLDPEFTEPPAAVDPPVWMTLLCDGVTAEPCVVVDALVLAPVLTALCPPRAAESWPRMSA